MPVSHVKKVIVTGATSQTGRLLLPMLAAKGFEICALSRSPSSDISGAKWLKCDLEQAGFLEQKADAIIHIAPITLAPTLLSLADYNLKRFICFSSTSIFIKTASRDPRERNLMEQMRRAEEEIISLCGQHGIAWTIVRPTLIYGLGLDRNIAVIEKFIKKTGFFPVAYKGRGKRQPVHAGDLAAACVNLLDNPNSFNKAYNLTGGETLSYYEMVRRIAQTRGTRVKIINLPPWLFRSAIYLLRLLPGREYMTTAMVDRMKQDLVFDHSEATRDFGYCPRLFSP